MLKTSIFLLLALVSPISSMGKENRAPILIELFTSEGCSSCPPADRLLEKLDQSQPIAGAQIIVLSEHVDYWNSIGWKDPYSAEFFSKRQSGYASHFGLNSVYTPQMVVDGSAEFVGSDASLATRALEKAQSTQKVAVRLSDVAIEKGMFRAHVESDAAAMPGEVFVVLALSRAESNVSRGENSGRHLTHVAVVKRLEKIGTMEKGKSFSKDVEIKLAEEMDPANLRVVAFVQEPGQRKVLGAAQWLSGK